MSADNGGPAFPANRDMAHNSNLDHEPGMTMRDYFAAKAMQAVLAQDGLCMAGRWRDGVALGAYMMADAMLAARAKP